MSAAVEVAVAVVSGGVNSNVYLRDYKLRKLVNIVPIVVCMYYGIILNYSGTEIRQS